MQMSTNILKCMAIQSVVQALGWGLIWLHSGIYEILENLSHSYIYLKTTKCIIMIPMEPYT